MHNTSAPWPAPNRCSAVVHRCTAPVHCRCTVHYTNCTGALSVPQCTAAWKIIYTSYSHRVYFSPPVMWKSGAERLRESFERKKQNKRERNARFYKKNKDRILKERKEQRRRKKPRVTAGVQSKGKLPKPNRRLYKARQRARKRQEKEKTSSKIGAVAPSGLRGTFVNRTELKFISFKFIKLNRPLKPTKNSLNA